MQYKVKKKVQKETKLQQQQRLIFLVFFPRLSIVNTEDGYSVFTLNPAAPSDAGLYKVVARNPLGQVTATIRVVLGDISGSPDSPMVEAMTDTDILLSWKTPAQLNHTPVIAYKIQMGYIGELLQFLKSEESISHSLTYM